ncbi:MAG: DUF423 domain-containing protein [Pseudomonadota bacterium]
MLLIIGAFLGFFSVAFGAYVEHALQQQVNSALFHGLMTAVRYNQFYAVVISAMGIATFSNNKLVRSTLFHATGYVFVLGTVLFCFSIYISVIFSLSFLLKLAPVGGVSLMVAWLMLVYCGFKFSR